MMEAAMLWNEPNNKSHWDPEVDPDWSKFGRMITLAGRGVKAANPHIARVLGDMSPIDESFVRRLEGHAALEEIDVLAVHGFPLDWNLWPIHEWPAKIAEIEAVACGKPVWVTEVGVGSFGAEEVQVFGVDRTAELLIGRVPRIFWYSLFDLPQEWGATTRHREAEGSSYYRHFYMGLIDAAGRPKLALDRFRRHAPAMGLMQWFHWQDPRLDNAVRWLRELGVTHLRTGLSWSDRDRPGALDWFDRQMEALAPFKTTVTFCFTPEEAGLQPHHTSAPRDPQGYADFVQEMVERYAPVQAQRAAA